ncbi:MAG: SHOCT domain-containing protein [Ramlibacter sp.]|nr:SHOCT domain-containing protein [Cryobacterium sp.]
MPRRIGRPGLMGTMARTAEAAGDDLSTQLEKLSTLKTAGVISDEEFTAAKAKLLGM